MRVMKGKNGFFEFNGIIGIWSFVLDLYPKMKQPYLIGLKIDLRFLKSFKHDMLIPF